MHKLTFYPIGNADTLFIELENGRVLIVDYANVRDANNQYDLRWDIGTDIAGKLTDKGRPDVDVFCLTHLDNDHVCNASEFFYLEHATKYQGEGRFKIKELWVPASAITEEGCEDAARVWRAEARYRLKQGYGIRVFARPDRLRDWLTSQGLSLESRSGLITDAGQLVPGFSLGSDNVEFFLHSPHAHRINERLVEDRNQDSVVMQATFLSGGAATRVMLAGDTTWESMEQIMQISKYHGNASRLEFDVFKLPHHCSYLSLSDEKGKTVTEPKPLVREWFEMADERATVISSSWPITTTDQQQPPHFQAAAYHRENIRKVNGQFLVTMERPSVAPPRPLVVRIDGYGSTVETAASAAAATIVTQTPPRAGRE